jgi:hypothetical protein
LILKIKKKNLVSQTKKKKIQQTKIKTKESKEKKPFQISISPSSFFQ